MISVIVPVYRGSDLLPGLLEWLQKDRLDKEIILAVDCPSVETKKFLKGLEGIIVLSSSSRRGKFKACNQAARKAASDKLVFLDDDVLPEKDILKRISSALDSSDIVDVRKEVVREGLISRMTYAEYVVNYSTVDIVSRNTGYGLVNGAAFGVRKKVFEELGGFRNCLAEDTDFSVRASGKYRFKFLRESKVRTVMRKTLPEFWEQKKRWVVGALEIIREHPEKFRKMTGSSPAKTLLWLLLSLPSAFWLPALLLFPTHFPPFALVLFLISFALYRFYSRSLGYEAKIIDYSLYFFLGSLVRMFFLAYGSIILRFFPEKIKDIDGGWVR